MRCGRLVGGFVHTLTVVARRAEEKEATTTAEGGRARMVTVPNELRTLVGDNRQAPDGEARRIAPGTARHASKAHRNCR